MSTKSYGIGFLSAAALLLAVATPAHAQIQDTRWLPYVGCWEPVDAGEDAGLLCFRPSADGVEMFNVVAGEVTASERLVADGQLRPVTSDGCTGTESVEFSEDGLRAFTSSDFVCEGEARPGTGLMSLIAPTQWIDVRSLDIDGDPVAWVQRYALATQEALDEHGADNPAASNRTSIRAARVRAARPIELDDVEEAAARVETRAVEVWVATNETELELTGGDLVRLADSGVPESLIDVMVAVSYPSRFVLSPEGAAAEAVAMGRVPGDAYRGGYRGFRSFLWDPFYSPIGYRYGGFGYSPFGLYGYRYGYGGYGGYYGYTPATVIVQPRAQGSTGRMVRGLGYTRGGSSGGGSGARPSYSGGGGGGGGGGAASPSRGGGGTRSSGSSGRTAQPRRGN